MIVKCTNCKCSEDVPDSMAIVKCRKCSTIMTVNNVVFEPIESTIEDVSVVNYTEDESIINDEDI